MGINNVPLLTLSVLSPFFRTGYLACKVLMRFLLLLSRRVMREVMNGTLLPVSPHCPLIDQVMYTAVMGTIKFNSIKILI